MPTSINFDPVQLGFGLYDRFNQDSGSAGDDARFMNDFAWKQSLRNEQFQNDLARHGIKMRVDDAVSAGLHPLVGAGINPASGGWSGPAFTGVSPKNPPYPMSGMGVNISRATAATASPEELQLRALELQRAKADTGRSMAEKAMADYNLYQMTHPAAKPIPDKYIQVRNEYGDLETIMNPDVAAGMMADPLNLWGNSFRKAFGGPDTKGIFQQNKSNPYGPGGYLYNIRTGGK